MAPTINREELAWAAGFFDGEGCTRYNKSRRHRGGNLEVTVTQTDTVTLKRFQRAALGTGRIYGPKDVVGGRPQWQFKNSSYEHGQAVIAMLWPFLSEIKRRQAHAALTIARDNWRMKPKTSRYRGVCYRDDPRYLKKWRAGIQIAGRWVDLGHFATEEDAHQARLAAERG